ncbi:esterase-like activity of phytase family protein [Croceicoccus pelagius]|uniref:Lipoprotein n=1 Tax=Croceicoccus pelagius TaxID=1703341 RepID=A0A917DG31_9SPHN|nr:esterase-like activity of phytase family protein [Croceicoccus pelagius]GGD34836.1 lipoprotein [Croceicoccus pelagius]
MTRIARAGGLLALLLLVWLILFVPDRTVPRGTRILFDFPVAAEPIEGAALDEAGPLKLAGAWRLTGEASEFHSLSGLALTADGRLAAVSDRGLLITMPKPGEGDTATARALVPDGSGGFAVVDSEAIVIDEGGTTWFARENQNMISRLGEVGEKPKTVRPAAMSDWSPLRGPETLARTPDGRFMVIGEGREDGRHGTFPGLMFDSDPVEAPEPWLFHVAMPDGLRPVEAAVLSDGTVLVLGRSFGLPFRFESALYAFDLADAKPASRVDARLIGRIGGPGISDNFEGMAVEEGADGALTIWVVSDSNDAQVMQSTILLKLETRKSALR